MERMKNKEQKVVITKCRRARARHGFQIDTCDFSIPVHSYIGHENISIGIPTYTGKMHYRV